MWYVGVQAPWYELCLQTSFSNQEQLRWFRDDILKHQLRIILQTNINVKQDGSAFELDEILLVDFKAEPSIAIKLCTYI